MRFRSWPVFEIVMSPSGTLSRRIPDVNEIICRRLVCSHEDAAGYSTSWHDAFRAVELPAIDNGSISQSSVNFAFSRSHVPPLSTSHRGSREKKSSKEGGLVSQLGTT
jgi:hypothetical protein